MINPNHVKDLRGCEQKVNLTSIVDERQRETNHPYRAIHWRTECYQISPQGYPESIWLLSSTYLHKHFSVFPVLPVLHAYMVGLTKLLIL